MAYIGVSPSNGVRRVHTYTATASQTTFSGAGAEGTSLSYKDSNFVDVYQNGIKLGDADYTSTSGTSIVLAQGASVDDLVVVVVFDVFSVADTVSKADGGTFDGNVTMAGTLGVTGTTALTGNATFSGDIIKSTSGTSNFAAGVNAGNSIASGGNFNTVVGDEAGTAITTGDENTFVGYATGDATTTGIRNIAIGGNALGANVAGDQSVAIGFGALFAQNPSGNADMNNVAIGYDTGFDLTTGIQNTLIGATAGDALTDADFNVALGYQALSADTKGSLSTAVGKSALANQNLTSATNTFNVAVGAGAGEQVTTGVENTLVGGVAGDALTDADHNVAIGFHALSSDTKGNRTTAIGRYAAYNQNFTSSTDTNNVYIGYYAGADATTGVRNTIVGSLGAEELTTADDCVGIGYLSLGGNAGGATTGHDNVCIGSGAGSALTTGERNTLVGMNTGNNGVQATDNIVIGQGSVFSSIDRSQSTMIGNGMTSQGTNTFLFGYGSSDTLCSFGSTSFSNPSDERYKEEIETSTAGLSFINDLRPVTFKWKKEKDIPSDHRAYKADSEDRVMLSDGKTQHGFIAQEVKTAIDNHSEIKDGFEGWNQDETDGRQRTSAIALIPMLVKAIQELSAEVKALKGE